MEKPKNSRYIHGIHTHPNIHGTYTHPEKGQIAFTIRDDAYSYLTKSSKVIEFKGSDMLRILSKINIDCGTGRSPMSNDGQTIFGITDIEYTNLIMEVLNNNKEFYIQSSTDLRCKIPGTWTGSPEKTEWRSKLVNGTGKLDPRIGNDLLGGRRRKRTIKRKRRSTRRRSA